MKIAFWSPLHGTGVTSDLLAASISMACKNRNKIIVTQNHFSMNNLENPLLGDISNEQFFTDTGLDAVIRHFKSGNLTKEQIENCSIRIINNMYLLTGTRSGCREAYENQLTQSMMVHIINQLETFCDIVMIDTNSGNNPASAEIIRAADVVAVTVRQNRKMLDELMENELLKDKKLFYIFGNYDVNSRYSLKNIRRLYKRINKENSVGVIHCTEYMDAIGENRVLKYVSSNIDEGKGYEDSAFFENVRELSEKLTGYANIGSILPHE